MVTQHLFVMFVVEAFKIESAILYFTRDCDQLNETEKEVVHETFNKVLDDQGVCKSRAGQVCDLNARENKVNLTTKGLNKHTCSLIFF